MPMVKINGLTYEFNDLPDEVKGHLKYMAFIDAELEQLGMRQNLLHIARDQIGQRMDRALLREAINQSPTDQAQPPVQPQAPEA
ncbi:hypothetical protein [Hydrogenophaga sp.]|uniref:hypothetical protein n=1 Tax=Hydrogenophaga sp. TaxID=1904254 RepID=UPI00286DCBA6|nr:hypothetical protein [Hydrogenophaga sp.]